MPTLYSILLLVFIPSLFASGVTPGLDKVTCAQLILRFGVDQKTLNLYSARELPTVFSLATRTMRGRLIAAATAGLYSDQKLGIYKDSGRALQSFYRLLLLGVPLKDSKKLIRPLVKKYIATRIVPGWGPQPKMPPWFLGEVAPKVRAGDLIGQPTASAEWIKPFIPFMNIGENILHIPMVNPPLDAEDHEIREAMAGNVTAMFQMRNLRLDDENEFEIWGYKALEVARLALAADMVSEATQLLSYLITMRDWSTATDLAYLLKHDVALFNIAMAQFAEASVRMAVKEVSNDLRFSTIRPLFSEGVRSLGLIQGADLRGDARRLLQTFADEISSARFIEQRKRDVDDWGLRDEIDYYALALDALRATGDTVAYAHSYGNTPKLLTVCEDDGIVKRIQALSDKILQHEEEFIPVSDHVVDALVSIRDVARLRHFGDTIFSFRTTGKHHNADAYYYVPWELNAAAARLDGNWSAAVQVIDLLTESGLPGNRRLSVARDDSKLLPMLREMRDEGLNRRYIERLNRAEIKYTAAKAEAVLFRGVALNEQEDLLPFHPTVADEFRSAAIDEIFRPAVLEKWKPENEEKRNALRLAVANAKLKNWRAVANYARQAQSIKMLIQAGEGLLQQARDSSDPLIGDLAFECFANAAVLEIGPAAFKR